MIVSKHHRYIMQLMIEAHHHDTDGAAGDDCNDGNDDDDDENDDNDETDHFDSKDNGNHTMTHLIACQDIPRLQYVSQLNATPRIPS